ncbi:MAG: Uma2 family endonuclease [Planctomycetes bacterium]|nr:Uma2 family endonuclease [Planctomycetota bacterium]
MVDNAKLTRAEQLLELPRDGQRHELVEGELRAMSPAGARHGAVAARALMLLMQHVEERGLGTVFAAETGFVLARDPDTVRAPDAAFVRAGRDATSERGFFEGPPDLALEVLSPGDAFGDVEGKAVGWLRAGCGLVVVLDPLACRATVYRDPADARLLSGDDVLDASDIVPGWRVPLAAFWPPAARRSDGSA